MLPAVRRGKLLAELVEGGVLSTELLAVKLGVSEETVRRDIVLLEGEGMLVRVHGGARSRKRGNSLSSAEPFYKRQDGAREVKSRIGGLAAALLKNGDIVGIDAGTTALQVALAIPADFTGVVATPSLRVAAELVGRPGIDVLVSGGSVRAGDLACSSAHAKVFFEDLHTDIAFLSSGGVSAADGLTDFYEHEVPIRRAMLKGTKQSFIVADSTKMDRVAPHHVCHLVDVDGLITDATPPAALDRRLRELGIEVILP